MLVPLLTCLTMPFFGFRSPDTISDTVVLLADDYVLRLPVECLKTFLVPRVSSFTRDFSLQFMYYRLHHNEGKNGCLLHVQRLVGCFGLR